VRRRNLRPGNPRNQLNLGRLGNIAAQLAPRPKENMKDLTPEQISGEESALELGKVLGQSIAFGTIAGRRSAAQAAALSKARQERIHLRFGLTWRDFCAKHFKISGSEVNRIIQQLDEFGPDYFEHTQSTRISPRTYRLIAPFIHDKALHYGGEALELSSANVQKVAQAVRESQPALPAPEAPAPEAAAPEEPALAEAAPPTVAERLNALERHITGIVSEIRAVSMEAREPVPISQFRGALSRMVRELRLVSMENGVV